MKNIFWLSCIVAAMILLPHSTLAQSITPVPADEVAKQEQMQLSPVRVGSAVVRPPMLDLYAICSGSAADAAALVDTDSDGYPDIMRFYATDKQWAKLGPSLLSPLRQIAEARAQAQVAKTVAVYIVAKDDTTLSSSSSMTLDDISTQINQESISSVSSEASAYIKGARVTNVKVVSLGPDQGICVVVRYDVPLSGNNLQPQTYNDNPPSPGSSPDSSANSTTDEKGYTLPPPGQSSN